VPLRNLKYSCISCVGKGVTEFLMSRRNTLPAGLSSEMFMDNSSPIQGPFRKAGRVNNPSYLHSFRVSVIAPNFFLLRRNSFSFLKRKQSYMNMRMADNKWPFFFGGGATLPQSSMIWLPFVYANSYRVSAFLLVEPYSLN